MKTIDEFVYKSNPNEWLEVSDELNSSVEILIRNSFSVTLKTDTWDGIPIKKVTTSRSIFLLMGLSLENLIKGIIVFDNPENINSGKLSSNIMSHNLVNLSNRLVEISFTDEEKQFIKNISDAIPDWGRYPSPLKYQDIKDEELYQEAINVTYIAVRKKLRENLICKLKAGWISGLKNKKTNVQIIEFVEK